MKKYFILLLILVLNLNSEVFEFKYEKGNKYRVLSRISEKVYINGKYIQNVEIHNKIAIEIKDVKGKSGYLSGSFDTSIKGDSGQQVFQRLEKYPSEYWCDEKGLFNIESKYYMPSLRNVPYFPNKDIVFNEKWSAEAEEVYDLRADFGISEPLSFPVQVNYTYKGKEKKKGKILDKFIIKFSVFNKIQGMPSSLTVYPVLISGTSSLELFWNSERGRPEFYQEAFNYMWNLSDGNTVEYLGRSEAEVLESLEMNKDDLVKSIQEKIDENNIDNTTVSKNDIGITISLDKIQFKPDSSILTKEEKNKLRKISEILKNHPDRDILITGHTALAGTLEGRKKLSMDRAAAVADFLLSIGVSSSKQMLIEGLGAENPIDSNETEEGREKNRRVEITILEN